MIALLGHFLANNLLKSLVDAKTLLILLNYYQNIINKLHKINKIGKYIKNGN